MIIGESECNYTMFARDLSPEARERIPDESAWQIGEEFQRKHPFIPKTVPGLDGVYLASMWTNAPGGLSGAAVLAARAVSLVALCVKYVKPERPNHCPTSTEVAINSISAQFALVKGERTMSQ